MARSWGRAPREEDRGPAGSARGRDAPRAAQGSRLLRRARGALDRRLAAAPARTDRPALGRERLLHPRHVALRGEGIPPAERARRDRGRAVSAAAPARRGGIREGARHRGLPRGGSSPAPLLLPPLGAVPLRRVRPRAVLP